MSHAQLIERILAEHLEKVRSSLENIRGMLREAVEAVPELPEASELAQVISSAIPKPEPPPPPPPPPPPAAPLNNTLLYRAASVEHADNQSEILNQLVTGLNDFAKRGVLFVVRGDWAQAWNSFGFDSPEAIKQWKTNVSQDPLLRTVFSSRTRMLLDNAMPGFIPEKTEVRRSLISPLLLKGKVLAFFYADSGVDGKLDHYSIDLLIRVASLVIDIFPLRTKREPLSPTLENQEIILPGSRPTSAKEEESPLFEDSGTLDSQDEVEELPGSQTMLSEIPPEAIEQTEPDRAEPSPPEEEVQPEPAPAPQEAFDEPVHEPMPEVIAAPPAAAAVPEEPPIPPEDMKIHQDAERFARLLVQEIVLYHPGRWSRGATSATFTISSRMTSSGAGTLTSTGSPSPR